MFLLSFSVAKHQQIVEDDPKMPKLSIPQWHDLAREGVLIPMRILIKGNSMFPLIRVNRDYVTIYPLEERPEVGDIVLFADPGRNRYVLHRAWQIKENLVLTWGDNCRAPDGWIPLELIWGKAVLIERGKREIRPERKSGMRLAGIWHRAGRVWRLSERYTRALKTRVRRFKTWIKR